jgi:anti-sigma regulatory factor (Ser/Thr protein kinase)
MEITVHDHGEGFDLESINGDATTPDRLLEPRGRGIYIMKNCMDSVDFKFTKDGTICRLVKWRPQSSAST